MTRCIKMLKVGLQVMRSRNRNAERALFVSEGGFHVINPGTVCEFTMAADE